MYNLLKKILNGGKPTIDAIPKNSNQPSFGVLANN
jgi:hypothetical protein